MSASTIGRRRGQLPIPLSSIDLPTQRMYLAQLTYPAPEDVVHPAAGDTCGICLEELVQPLPLHFEIAHGPHDSELVVHAKPCRHLFHHPCIVDWHSSTRPERNTCPICRCELFIADPLTAEQVRQMQVSDLRDRIRIGDEVCVHIEHMAMDTIAKELVDSTKTWARWSWRRRLHGWPYYLLCKGLRDVTVEDFGPLRAPLEPYKDTFVLIIVAVPLLVYITRHTKICRRADLQWFLDWLNALSDWLGPVLVRQLNESKLRHGLFDGDMPRMGFISRDYVEKHEEAAQWMLRASQVEDDSGVLAKIGRCLARTVPIGLMPERPDRKHATVLSVLRKISSEGRPAILRYVERDRVGAVRVQE